MHSIRPEKAAKVAELKDLMTGSKGVILVDYCGLTVAEDTDLRRKMREAGVTYMVAKNTFVRIAAKEAGIEGLDSFLEHNTALAFSAEDPVAPAKILSEFAKDHKALEIKAGILDPAKVTRSALQNATSVASTLLTTESVVANIKEETPAMPAGAGGMGGMM